MLTGIFGGCTKHISLDPGEDPLKNIYDTLGGQFEWKLLKVASNFVNQELNDLVNHFKLVADTLEPNYQINP